MVGSNLAPLALAVWDCLMVCVDVKDLEPGRRRSYYVGSKRPSQWSMCWGVNTLPLEKLKLGHWSHWALNSKSVEQKKEFGCGERVEESPLLDSSAVKSCQRCLTWRQPYPISPFLLGRIGACNISRVCGEAQPIAGAASPLKEKGKPHTFPRNWSGRIRFQVYAQRFWG